MPRFHVWIGGKTDGWEAEELVEAASPEEAQKKGVLLAAASLPDEMPEVTVEYAAACNNCGSDQIATVEVVSASAGIQDVRIENGKVTFDWTGSTEHGEGETVGFQCEACGTQAKTLEALFGMEDEDEGGLECECGAGPFSDEEAIRRHREQWHAPAIEEAILRHREYWNDAPSIPVGTSWLTPRIDISPPRHAAPAAEREQLRSWWWIVDASTSAPVTRVAAVDGFDALNAFCEAEGFGPYVHPDKATQQEKDEGIVAFIHEDRWHGVFTNLNIYAERDRRHDEPPPTAKKILSDEERLAAIDAAWYEQTKGELLIGPDAGRDRDLDVEKVLLALWTTSEVYLRSVAEQQYDVRYGLDRPLDELDEDVEIPRRVARALSVLWSGA